VRDCSALRDFPWYACSSLPISYGLVPSLQAAVDDPDFRAGRAPKDTMRAPRGIVANTRYKKASPATPSV